MTVDKRFRGSNFHGRTFGGKHGYQWRLVRNMGQVCMLLLLLPYLVVSVNRYIAISYVNALS